MRSAILEKGEDYYTYLKLFISKNDELVEKFRAGFPLAEDLSAKNKRQNSEVAHVEELLIKELRKRNLELNEENLHKKYQIWSLLYVYRKKKVQDEDILKYIDIMFHK
ncbi:hypothetical protein [Clostridium sp. 'White wine YQ']|uniref:hypothetical protein n=1 Tax=Clostridium sp. 'White wine YQ' TaxID=3027474 RepID=UPI002366CE89|nr:hypothetical protein [Clostridium sp. 'White wine YQ']MDD7794314.1 hypothetical protein [Clostridium sp. 'White wine YQ']